MNRRAIPVATVSMLAQAAIAEPFWVAYEGDDLPTNQGWFRNTIGPPALLSASNGLLTIDSTASVETADLFEIQDRPIVLGLGEHVVVEWRVNVAFADSPGPWDRDVMVTLVTPDQWILRFVMNEASLESYLESSDPTITYAAGFHDFRVVSSDLRTYVLSVDGQAALSGTFYDGLGIPRVGWGDAVQGARSLSQWDYFRFGVIPEPSSLVSLTAIGISGYFWRRK